MKYIYRITKVEKDDRFDTPFNLLHSIIYNSRYFSKKEDAEIYLKELKLNTPSYLIDTDVIEIE